MDEGTKVQVDWNKITSATLIDKIAAIGNAVLEIVYYDGVGICLVQLPKGMTLPDFSMGSNGDQQCIELHQLHLKPAA